jgi:hypothetical protein
VQKNNKNKLASSVQEMLRVLSICIRKLVERVNGPRPSKVCPTGGSWPQFFYNLGQEGPHDILLRRDAQSVFLHLLLRSKYHMGGHSHAEPCSIIITTLNMEDQPLKAKRHRRSFKVVKALDKKCSDQSLKLDESRLEIDAKRGRVVQAGCRAGSSPYKLLKAFDPRSATLPFSAFVLLTETTRGSRHKQYAYQVSLHALPKDPRPQGMRFAGAYRTSATKLSIKAFDALTPRANGRKSKATTTP